MPKNNPANNIYLQSKRASKIFDIPLSKAKTLIARVVYQCHDFRDLIKKFDNNSFKASVYPFCLIGPHATHELKAFFEKNVDQLCERFSKNLVKPFSYIALLRAVKFIFGLADLSVKLEVQHHFVFNESGIYPCIQDNNCSIFFKDFKMNEVSYRILAIRVLTADLFENLTISQVSKLRVELAKNDSPSIMWQSLKKSEDAIRSFLIDDVDAACSNTFNECSQPQNESQKDFMSVIKNLWGLIRKENAQVELKPTKIGDHFYCIFGYPIHETEHSDTEFTESRIQLYLNKEHVQNNRAVFAIGDGMICLDLFEHDGQDNCISENREYFSEFSATVVNFKGSSTEHIVIDGKLYIAYFRPCTELEYERFFSAALVVKNIYS